MEHALNFSRKQRGRRSGQRSERDVGDEGGGEERQAAAPAGEPGASLAGPGLRACEEHTGISKAHVAGMPSTARGSETLELALGGRGATRSF